MPNQKVTVFYKDEKSGQEEKSVQTKESHVELGNSNFWGNKPDNVREVGHCEVTRIVPRNKVAFIGALFASLLLGYSAVKSAYTSTSYQVNAPVVQNGRLESDALVSGLK